MEVCMIIGIMSDSHDNLDRIKQAIDKFNNLAVGYVIHLGDICSPFSVRLFDELKCDYIGVFGNNDGELIGISKLSHGKFHKPPFVLEIGGCKLVLLHEGDGAYLFDDTVDFVLYGHSHKAEIVTKGRQMIINPGTVSGYLSDKATVAILDTDKRICSFVEF